MAKYTSTNPSPSFSEDKYVNIFNKRREELIQNNDLVKNIVSEIKNFTDPDYIFKIDTGGKNIGIDFENIFAQDKTYASIFKRNKNYLVFMHGTQGGNVLFGGGVYNPTELIERFQKEGLIEKNAQSIYTMSCYGGLQDPGVTSYGAKVSSMHSSDKPIAAYAENNHVGEMYFAMGNGKVRPEFAKYDVEMSDAGKNWKIHKQIKDTEKLAGTLKGEFLQKAAEGTLNKNIAKDLENEFRSGIKDEVETLLLNAYGLDYRTEIKDAISKSSLFDSELSLEAISQLTSVDTGLPWLDTEAEEFKKKISQFANDTNVALSKIKKEDSLASRLEEAYRLYNKNESKIIKLKNRLPLKHDHSELAEKRRKEIQEKIDKIPGSDYFSLLKEKLEEPEKIKQALMKEKLNESGKKIDTNEERLLTQEEAWEKYVTDPYNIPDEFYTSQGLDPAEQRAKIDELNNGSVVNDIENPANENKTVDDYISEDIPEADNTSEVPTDAEEINESVSDVVDNFDELKDASSNPEVKEVVDEIKSQSKLNSKTLSDKGKDAISDGLHISKGGKIGIAAGIIGAAILIASGNNNKKSKAKQEQQEDKQETKKNKEAYKMNLKYERQNMHNMSNSYEMQLAQSMSSYKYGKHIPGFINA